MDSPFARQPVKPTSKYFPIWQAVINGDKWAEEVAPEEQERKRATWWGCLNRRGVPLTSHYDPEERLLTIMRWVPADE